MKNYRTPEKEIEEDIRRWKDFPCSWSGRINTVKMLQYQKQCTDSMQSSSKLQCHSSQKWKNEFKTSYESSKDPE
jgi:hypothetical protein